MEPWCKSDITLQRLAVLFAATFFALGLPLLPDGYVISFTHFHEQGFTTPAHKFLRGLLHYYKVELQHLNPNGIQHITAFIALCEGFLGISPHSNLWWYFFAVTLLKKQELNAPMGCASI